MHAIHLRCPVQEGDQHTAVTHYAHTQKWQMNPPQQVTALTSMKSNSQNPERFFSARAKMKASHHKLLIALLSSLPALSRECPPLLFGWEFSYR